MREVDDELFIVLEKTNARVKEPVNEELLKQILSRVIRNPLDADRAKCQDQIDYLIKQMDGKGKP